MKFPVQKECRVSGSLSVVLLVSKIFGLASLKFKKVRGGWCIHFSSAASLYGKIIVCFICLMTLVLLILNFHVEYQLFFKTNSDTAACIGTITFITLSLLVATYSGTRRMQCVINSLAQLHKVNVKLSQYGPPTQFKTPILFISFIGVHLLFGIVFCGTMYYWTQMKIDLLTHVFDASLNMEIFLNKLLILQVTLILAVVPASFSCLNDCLTNLLRQVRNHDIPYNPAKTAATVKHLSTSYDYLCAVVKHIDSSHGVLLAAFIPYFLSSLVITLYNLITGPFAAKPYGRILEIIFIIIHTTSMIMIIEPCHLTYEQMNRTKRLIGQLLLFTPTKHHEVIHELELFYKHLMKDVVYTPMGIFYLNRTVIVTIVGSITTYLMVMVQL